LASVIAPWSNGGRQFLWLVRKRDSFAAEVSQFNAISAITPIRFRQREQSVIIMKTFITCVIVLSAILWGSPGMALATRVIINLSDQRASLVEQGRITLVSPVASGKPGWQTPTGNFSIFSKDINHFSGNFGSVVDAYGRVVNSSATPGSYLPRGGHFDPRRCRTSWNSARQLGCTPDTSQDTLRPTDACGCLEISLLYFFSGFKSELQSRSSVALTI
jgi:hypothetical protein